MLVKRTIAKPFGNATFFYCFGTKMAVLSRDIFSGETFWLTIIDDIS